MIFTNENILNYFKVFSFLKVCSKLVQEFFKIPITFSNSIKIKTTNKVINSKFLSKKAKAFQKTTKSSQKSSGEEKHKKTKTNKQKA